MQVDQARRLKDLEQENNRLKKLVADLSLDNSILKEGGKGKLLSPSKRRRAVEHVCYQLSVSERRACRVLGQTRSTQRHDPHIDAEEQRLILRIIELASKVWQVWVQKNNSDASTRGMES